MALELSDKAEQLSQARVVQPIVILEIEGVFNKYSTAGVTKKIELGDGYFLGDDIVLGGIAVDKSIKTYITSSGSGGSITQQLLQDKGAASSVSSLPLELVDKNGEITTLISPGFIVNELLAKRAIVYLNFSGGFHPKDSVIIHRGIIDDIQSSPASIRLNIASAEQLKRQTIFVKQETELVGNINNSQTTITVNSTEGFIDPSSEIHTSYIQINDEIIKWATKNDTQFLGCTRAQLGTIAASGSDGDSVDSFYRLQANAIDLALKLMLSGGDQYFVDDVQPLYIGSVDGVTLVDNAVFFEIPNIQDLYGLVPGDLFSITDSASNDVVDGIIIACVVTEDGSYIITDQTFTIETLTAGVVGFRSQYNVLNEGMAMTPQDVDVERHLDLASRFFSSIPDYDFYLKDDVTAKDFLSEEIYLPAGLYSLPRKTRASVGITLPPIADTNIVYLTSDNIVLPSKLMSQRSVNKYFYNSVIFKYDELALDDKFINGKIIYSATSQERFKPIGNKPFKVVSKGLRPSPDTETLIRINSRRILERYENAAELLPKIGLLFKDGFKIDVGDTVVFGDSGIKMSDPTNGTRNREPRIYEVQNKSLNLKNGEVTVDLLSTNFALNGRYGIVSPSSYVDIGSTTTEIVIKDSFATTYPSIERDKWADYVGQTILVRSTDWLYAEETIFLGFSATDNYVMNVDPPLPSAPLANYIVDIPTYPASTDADVNSFYKIVHCFFDPQLVVVSGTSSTVFDVSSGDAAKIFVGSVIRIHSEDFLIDSGEINVSDITGTTITVDADIGFTPSAGQLIDLVGFIDRGAPYRLV